MTVYVVQEKPGVDMTDALRFGDFQELLPRKDQLIISAKPVLFSLKNKTVWPLHFFLNINV